MLDLAKAKVAHRLKIAVTDVKGVPSVRREYYSDALHSSLLTDTSAAIQAFGVVGRRGELVWLPVKGWGLFWLISFPVTIPIPLMTPTPAGSTAKRGSR